MGRPLRHRDRPSQLHLGQQQYRHAGSHQTQRSLRSLLREQQFRRTIPHARQVLDHRPRTVKNQATDHTRSEIRHRRRSIRPPRSSRRRDVLPPPHQLQHSGEQQRGQRHSRHAAPLDFQQRQARQRPHAPCPLFLRLYRDHPPVRQRQFRRCQHLAFQLSLRHNPFQRDQRHHVRHHHHRHQDGVR